MVYEEIQLVKPSLGMKYKAQKHFDFKVTERITEQNF